jgi:N-acetyl-anhydromuramoyl-L-alanine amidase
MARQDNIGRHRTPPEIRQGWLQGAKAIPSPNWDDRPAGEPITLLVVHNISLPPGEFGGPGVIDLFLNQVTHDTHPYYEQLRGLRVSSHFYIRRTGELIQFVACDHRAWHAGKSYWRGRERCNDFSIGIELEGTDNVPFTDAQYVHLCSLVRSLRAHYPIVDIAGHSDIAPGRKTDPGPHFDWSRLPTTL